VGNKELNRGFDYYAAAIFQGRRWEWVDPQKEATAKEKLYNLKVTSLSQIIRERGDDPEVVFAEIAEENEKLNALGITPGQVLEKIIPAQEQQPNEQTENEQTED
jgi:capsid protein